MQCYTELIPPTAVSHAVSLPFLGPRANNLVVAKTSLLQVFRLNHVRAPPGRNGSVAKLALVGEYQLAGTVTSLRTIKTATSKTGGSALLIAFKDAKLSLVEWDPENHRISTVSIHYYEGENITTQLFGPTVKESQSILSVDPNSRCAALKFGQRQLAILPFRQAGDDVVEDADNDVDTDMAEPQGPESKKTAQNVESDAESKMTPYKASFVLPLTMLDPSLTHPVDLAFLHEYREPTFGILSSSQETSCALLEERKDCLTYTVFTLDLEQRASTNLVSVPKLPSDLWRVIALPMPVGGALLVGTNELVHVDQSGKQSAVAVNEFAREASSFNMVDHSGLNMRLEGCELEMLEGNDGDMLIALNDGSLAILHFKLVGRNVAGLHISPVVPEQSGAVHVSSPSSIAVMSGQNVFIASEDGNSSLLACTKDMTTLSRKRSHAQMLDQEAAVDDEEDPDDIDEDDLYAPTAEAAKRTASVSSQTAAESAASYRFAMQDELHSLGPINNICIGKSRRVADERLELVAGAGRGHANRLAFLSREVTPHRIRSTMFSSAKRVWSTCVRSKEEAAAGGRAYDNLVFIYDGEQTKVYDVRESATNEDSREPAAHGYFERTGTEYEHEGETVAIGTLGSGTRLVQCRRTELRTYDPDLSLSQIIPMVDEESDAELQIVSVSFCDPYVMVLRDDSSVQMLKMDKNGDVEPLDETEASKSNRWLSGCLYASEAFDEQCCLWLLGDEGGLSVLKLPDLELIYCAASLPFLPPVLWQEMPQRRGGKEALTELLIADLGTEDVKQPYLIARSSLDDLAVYEPFWYHAASGNTAGSGFEGLRWRKVPNTYSPKYDDGLDTEGADARPSPLESAKVGGRHVVYIPGRAPSLMTREPTSLPKVLGLRSSGVRAFAPLSRSGCEDAFMLIGGDGMLGEYRVPANITLETGWNVEKLALGEPAQVVRYLAYHTGRGVYIIATCRDVDFYLVDQDGHVDTEGQSCNPLRTLHTSCTTSIYVSFCFLRGATSIVGATAKFTFLPI